MSTHCHCLVRPPPVTHTIGETHPHLVKPPRAHHPTLLMPPPPHTHTLSHAPTHPAPHLVDAPPTHIHLVMPPLTPPTHLVDAPPLPPLIHAPKCPPTLLMSRPLTSTARCFSRTCASTLRLSKEVWPLTGRTAGAGGQGAEGVNQGGQPRAHSVPPPPLPGPTLCHPHPYQGQRQAAPPALPWCRAYQPPLCPRGTPPPCPAALGTTLP